MRIHQNVRVSPSQAPALSSGTDSQNVALRVGSGNLQPTGSPIVTRTESYNSVELTNYIQSRNKKANATSLRGKRSTNRPAPDGIFTKAELQSDRYITYRAKQKVKARGIWSDKLEAIFQQALREIPNLGKKKTDCDPQQCGSFAVSRASGRNEHITHFIQNRTGEYRCRKQVSSHIQVLKHFQKDNEAWLRLVTKPEPDTQLPESYTINVRHRYPIHEMPSHASDSFNGPATAMDVNSSLSTEMRTNPLTGYRFSSSLPDPNLPIIETCTSQKFYFRPSQSTPSPPRYYPSSQDIGHIDVQFVASNFFTHQQNSGQDMPRQVPSNQLDPLQIGNIRDQDFNNCIPNPFPFFDDCRNPRDGPLTSSATPAPLATILDRQVHNVDIHQHSPPAPQHPQFRSTQPSNPHGDPFDDTDNRWMHHNTPIGSGSRDGSRDLFDGVDAWPLQMDQNGIDTWPMNLKCDNTVNHHPTQKPNQSDDDNHHQQQHDSSSATTPSRNNGSFSDQQHQPAEQTDHVTDLLTQNDHHTQLQASIDIEGAEDAEGDLDDNVDVASPHAPHQEENVQMQDIKVELAVGSML